MPEFDYRAVDPSGRQTSGRMVAQTANDVVARLSQQGLVIQGLQVVQGVGSQVSTGRTLTPIVQGGQGTAQAVAQPMSAPAGVSMAQPQYQQHRVAPAATTAPVKRKLTGFFKDYDLWMLLAQMGTILRAGISSTEMLQELSSRASIKPKARKAMEEMARMTAAGSALSDAMEVYPEIFPDGVVGSTRAGEVGGYLPDALSHTSEQIQASWKVRRHYLWTSLSIFSTVILIPFIPVMRAGSRELGNVINTGAGKSGEEIVGGYFDAIKGALFGVPGLMLIAICMFFLFTPYIFGRIWFLPIRHMLSARLPILGRRARLETSRELSFHLERLSIAGVSPYRAFGNAAAAVPNKVYRDQLLEIGRPFREDTPLSQMMPRHLVRDDFVDLIRTGEMTGTTNESFRQIERMSAGEQENIERLLKVKAWVWVVLFVFGVSSIIAAIMMRQFYDEMWTAIFDGTGW